MTRDALATLGSGVDQVKRGFLYALIGSVGVGALMAITVIVSGEFEDLKALVSTFTIAAASGCGLGCGTYLASARSRALPLLGIILATAAAAAVLLIIWAELDDDDHDMFWKTTGTLWILAVAVAHLCVLSLARLAAGFEWALVVAYIVILFVAALITIMIWFDVRGGATLRLLAAAVIVDAAVTVVIPIFHRLSREA